MCFFCIFLGAPPHACKRSGHHLVAYEAVPPIFQVIISPLFDATPLPSIAKDSVSLADDDDASIQQVSKHSCIDK